MPVVWDISTQDGVKAFLQGAFEAGCRPLAQLYNPKGKRTDDQNRLINKSYELIAEAKGDETQEDIRAYCKLHFGVPIRRRDDDEYQAMYDKSVRPLEYADKLEIMKSVKFDFPVTRNMTVKQLTEYYETMIRHYAEQGVVIPEAA